MSHGRGVWSLAVAGLTIAAAFAAGQTQPGGKVDLSQQTVPGAKVDMSSMTPEERQRAVEKMQEQAREQASENVRTELGATTEEWKTIRPVFDKFNTAYGDLRTADQLKPWPVSFTFFEPVAADARRPLFADLKAKIKELKVLVEDPKSNEKDIAKKLAEVRAARDLMKKDLDKARSALTKVLTKRQMALLVMDGKME